jgi:uncharacterized protein YbaP (TraB family)
MKQIFATLIAIMLPLCAQAGCHGVNLFDALPPDRQAALTAAADAVPYARGILFSADRGDQHLTLVGTYHLPDPHHAETLAAIVPALQGAKTLLVEAGPKEEAALAEAMKSDPTLMFTSGPTLPEVLPEQAWRELKAATTARGMPGVLVAKMQPAFVAVTLAMPPCAMQDMAQGGLDKQIMAAAAGMDLPVRALEPYDTIFRVFEKIPPEAIPDMLRAAVIGARTAEDTSVTMAELYFREEPRLIWEFGREQALEGGMTEADVTKQMELSEELLIATRNRAWLPVIEDALADGPAVLAAGALHLSGEAGLLALLRADGFTITRLQR